KRLVRLIGDSEYYGSILVHRQYIPPREAVFGRLSPALPAEVSKAVRGSGISRLYSHQVEAIEAIRRGENVLVATPTASGKTLIYNLPVLESCLADSSTRALYLFPLKALEQDQLRKLTELAEFGGGRPALRAQIYDGDTNTYQRRKIMSDPPNVLLTNPDMLHLGILANHERWEKFFRGLRFVVVDELHTYKGIFGAHFSGVMTRLRRIAAYYGASPVFISSSATVGNPGAFARLLFGLPFSVIDQSGAPGAGRYFLFVNPQEVRPSTVAARLLRDLIGAGLKTIAFAKSRRNTELIHSWILHQDPALAQRISSYRAGYLPAERRQIEQSLALDELDGVISTSALEMGIDIGGLDACILVGYPGTVTKTWQRGGRVGRSGRESVIVLIAQADALDQFFMRHPEDFFSRGCELALVDPENPFILRDHVECAAAELPLAVQELETLGPGFETTARELLARGRLVESIADHRLFSARKYPHREVSLRQTGEGFTILDMSVDPPERIGSVGGSRTLAECHEGAIYLHRARQYVVRRLDLEKHNVYVVPSHDPYYTQVDAEKDTEILETLQSKPEGNFVIRFGRLKVTERITGFKKRSISSQELLSSHPLELPPQIFETTGFWIEIPAAVPAAVEGGGLHFMGGIHAVEHAAISIFPLFVLSDRDDIGGICFNTHPQVGGPAIFIYDGYPGGVGIAHGGYERVSELLEATRKLIRDCACENGCPSCVHSPKCGSGNKPLDKAAAVLVLEYLTGLKDLPVVETVTIPEKKSSAEEEPVEQAGGYPPGKKILVFDLETQRSAEEVGGWRNKHLMRLSVAVARDVSSGEVYTFTEHNVGALLELLFKADLVVGFNVIDFDYQVLRAYSPKDLAMVNTFDILQDVHRRLGYRVSLNDLARATLDIPKTADGLMAIKWFKEGNVEKIIDYCRNDVNITYSLFEHGLKNGFFLFEHKSAGIARLQLDWDLSAMLAGRS
ncbi:MAG TPA: DEAD/DEAH box helicase, partial [Candidatus Glassbacteria bacterium]|nr:DEAD/DEAH box helicase [Candidatus Glassbacteria bacterium]